jgi:phosphoribosylaminoimidazole (AIR) synthetase
MSVSAVSGDSGSQALNAQVERAVLAIKKQQDAQTAQAEALIRMIQQSNPQVPSGTDGVGTLLSVYA